MRMLCIALLLANENRFGEMARNFYMMVAVVV